MDQPGLDLCTRDKSGSSPFATAMTMKNNKAAQKILQLEPQAAEQFDSRGRNFLHTGKYSVTHENLDSPKNMLLSKNPQFFANKWYLTNST